jgi:hypothetical protein
VGELASERKPKRIAGDGINPIQSKLDTPTCSLV